jgi:hypothetical protein
MRGADSNAQRESSSGPTCTSHTATASPRTSTPGTHPAGAAPLPPARPSPPAAVLRHIPLGQRFAPRARRRPSDDRRLGCRAARRIDNEHPRPRWERPGRRLRQGQPSNSPHSFAGQDQSATAGQEPAETPVTGCWDGDGRLVTDVARCVVEYRCCPDSHGGGLRGVVNLAAPACGPGGLSRRSVPIGRYSVGVDARVDAAVPDGCDAALAAAGAPSIPT